MVFARLALILAISIPAVAQISNPGIIYVGTVPSGSCPNGSTIRVIIITGIIYSCQSGTWGTVAGGGSGMVYPGAGVAVSTGSAWGTSIVAATLPRLNVANAFTQPITVNSGVLTNDTLQLLRNAGSGENLLMSNALTNGVVDIGFSGTGALWRAGIGNALETSSGIANKFYIRNQTSGTWGIVLDTAGQVAIGIQPVYPTLFPCRLNVGSGSSFCVDDFGAVSAKQLTIAGPSLIDSLATQVRTITTAHDNAQTNDFFIPCDTTANSIGFDLSPIPVTGQLMSFVKTDASANTCTLNGNGFLIEGASTLVLGSQYEGVLLQYSGTKWLVASHYNPTTLNGYCPLTGCTYTGPITAPTVSIIGTLGAGLLAVSNYCVAATANSACGTNSSGGIAMPTGTSAITVNTTKVTANSKIMIQPDASIGSATSSTCWGIPVGGVVTARVSATSFTFTIATPVPAAVSGCYTFTIIG